MFLYSLLVTTYITVCFLLVLIILIQKGKSSMGLGSMGGGSQMLFGGSGGQDVFQKTTWVLGALFISLSIILTFMRSKQSAYTPYAVEQSAPVAQEQEATTTESAAQDEEQESN